MTTESMIPTSTSDVPAGLIPAPRDPDPAPLAENTAVPRVLRNLSHGGHALVDELIDEQTDASARGDQVRASTVAGEPVTTDNTTPFGYLFADLADTYPARHLTDDTPDGVVAALKALGSAMIEEGPGADSTIPPIYTYWGQFIDHDLTANTDRDDDLSITERELVPLVPGDVVRKLRNLRKPALDLDSLYGDGPRPAVADGVPYVGNKFKLSDLATANPSAGGGPFAGGPVAGVDGGPDPQRDLPRVDGGATARVGDGRNDENLIVAQLHVAFLRFHNEVVDLLDPQGLNPDDDTIFQTARRLVRWTYQWLVVNDFLARLVPADVIDAVQADPQYTPTPDGAYMPLEFSVAAFRFGHSMIRGAYDYNRNFGKENGVLPVAPFSLLFTFTGKASRPFNEDPGVLNTLPDNWPIDWARFVGGPTAEDPTRTARRIDARLDLPLDGLSNEGTDPNLAGRIRSILKRLAVRNLMRGYKLAMPTGQAVCAELGVTPLTPVQLQQGNGRILNHALADGEFLQATPLWFYILKEADVVGSGNQLGPVGGRIVAETILGQLRADAASFMNAPQAWDPGGPDSIVTIGGPDIRTISDLLRFAGLLA